ncbi:MAG: hypothetical protein NZ703_06570, partial [Gemmataceae bacterium]|nr:hypothetical protein [Gemmataceae bacterium]
RRPANGQRPHLLESRPLNRWPLLWLTRYDCVPFLPGPATGLAGQPGSPCSAAWVHRILPTHFTFLP